MSNNDNLFTGNDSNTENKSGGETIIDTGWRSKMNSAADENREDNRTVVDTGWRTSNEKHTAEKETSDIDDILSIIANSDIPSDEDDTENDDNRTIVDTAWPAKMNISASSGNKDNAFRTIDEFKKAVAKLPEIVSVNEKRYKILRELSNSGGEAAILLCENSEQRTVVAKVYYESVNGPGSSISARRKVLDYMATEDGKKYTLPVEESDFIAIEGCLYYFEIMPYCSEGDLSQHEAMSFSEIVEITRFLNEALHSMHEYGLIHRDIKPSNIYKLDGRYVIGDFGVAKLASDGVAETTRFHVGTDGYCAPETLIALSNNPTFKYDTRCDYYSIGPTLASLFEGKFIYSEMDNEEIMACIQNGRLPLLREDPHRAQLENLLAGLCSFSANTRFDYRDVQRWLLDHDYKGGAGNAKWPKKFIMLGEEYTDDESFFYGITKDKAHWEEGKDLLFGKFFEQFFKSFRTDLARAAQLIEEKWRVKKDMDKGLSLFLKTLYKPGPIVWKGYTYNRIEELAEKMLVTKVPASYAELLKKNCISDWLENTSGIDVSLDKVEIVKKIESCSLDRAEAACYWFANCFASSKKATVCGKEISDLNALVQQLFSSPRTFYLDGGLEHLSNFVVGASMYGFLYSLGYEELINRTWSSVNGSNKFFKVCELIAMIDVILQREGADTSLIRSFFVKYGPCGAAEYTRQLVLDTQNPVYIANDKEGKKVLDAIASFVPVTDKTVTDMIKAYSMLVVNVEDMRAKLTDNPFSIMSGAYTKSSIICRNMVGVFAFDFLERKAPLGFCALLENADGGNK